MSPKPLVIIAEDDPDYVMFLEMALQDAGMPFHVAFVSNGEQLLDYLVKHADQRAGKARLPKALVLDLNMPKMDGRTALGEIRKHPKLESLPVIVLTISEAPKDKELCKRLGVLKYIDKPVTYEGWLEVVRYIDSFVN